MILEGAIGDAYGAGFEFANRIKIILFNKVSKYFRHPFHKSIYKKYTDDTQMAIALAELLVSEKEWTNLSVANKFVETFHRDKRKGYAHRFYQLMNKVKSGEELLEKIIPTSTRNGAAMRAYPLGVLKTEKEILLKSQIQAEITHHTKEGVLSAQAISLMSHFFIYKKGKRSNLIDYLHEHQKHLWNAKWKGKVEVDAMQTVEAVLTILLHGNNLKDMLKKSVDFGGDVDTVASLALAIGSLDENIENNLPVFLYEEIENGKYGREYLFDLDKKLIELKRK